METGPFLANKAITKIIFGPYYETDILHIFRRFL